MKVRSSRAMVAIFAGMSLLTGCLFESRKDPEPSLRYVVLGDRNGIPVETDFAPTIVHSGLYLAWTSTKPGSDSAHRMEDAHLDSAGDFTGSGYITYGDSILLASPRVSAYRLWGRVMAWIRNTRGKAANEVQAMIVSSTYSSPGEESPSFAELGIARQVTALALPDNGYLLGVAGFDTAGKEGIWIQRFDPKAKPEGDLWHVSGSGPASAPELILMPEGGWTAIWRESGTDGSRIVWQRFDSEGNVVRPAQSRPLSSGSTDATTLRADPLPAGRILVQARSGSFAPFLIGADGEAENDWPDAGEWEGAMLAADTLRHRFYGLRGGKVLRLDSAFRVQATRDLPALLEWPPALAVLPAGKIALIGHGDGSRPVEERNALLVHTVDPP